MDATGIAGDAFSPALALTGRTGRVRLRSGAGNWDEFIVREWNDGDIDFFLTAFWPGRWVGLQKSEYDNVIWDQATPREM